MGMDHGDEGTGRALVPSSGDGDRPTFTQEDLAHISSSDPGGAGSQPAVPATRAAAEARLAEVQALRKTDPRRYYGDAIQAEELALIRAIAQGEASGEEGAPGLPAELLEQWDRQGGREFHLAQAQATVQAMFDGMGAADAEEFQSSFDALPAGARTETFRFLAIDGGAWSPATEAAMEKFAGHEEGAMLIKEWGSRAARNVGKFNSRIRIILKAMNESDSKAARAWLDGLNSAQAAAMARALVR